MDNRRRSETSKAEVMDQIILGKTKKTLKQYIPEETLKWVDIDKWSDYMSDTIVMQFTAWLTEETLVDTEQTVIFKHPASWWEHFKQEKFPQWLLKRFPARQKCEIKTLHFERTAIYPEAPVMGKPYQKYVIKERLTQYR